MADSSFDVVSKVDRQEVDNALNQAAKELATRFDFRGTDTPIAWQGEETIAITSSTEERAKAAIDVFKEKLIRRDISMKAGVRDRPCFRRPQLVAQPDRWQLVEHPGDPDRVAGLPRPGAVGGARDGARTNGHLARGILGPPGVACKVLLGSETS